MTSNTESSNWNVAFDIRGSTCQFEKEAYHASQVAYKNLTGAICIAQASNFRDFVYKLDMTIVQGDYGGIVFRYNTASNSYYDFVISRDSSYQFYVQVGNEKRILVSGEAPSIIHTGYNQQNQIVVVAQESNFSIYVNDNLIANVLDSTMSIGRIGVIAAFYQGSAAADVAFSNAKVWALP